MSRGSAAMRTPAASYALLSDGSTVEIRPARPEDADDIRQMHLQMSPDNAYFRFFSFSPQAPGREALRLTRPGGPDHAALLARLEGDLIGVASYEPTSRPGVAEIAFAVSDEMHGRGVATLLLEHLVSLARQRRLTAFAAETLPENVAMQRVFADAGLPVERHFADGVIELTMPCPAMMADGSTITWTRSRGGQAGRGSEPAPPAPASIGRGDRRGPPPRLGRHGRSCTTSSLPDSPGRVYAVNPHGLSMEGIACLGSAADLPRGRGHRSHRRARQPRSPAVAAQCGRRGVRSAGRDHGGPGRRRRGPAGDLPPVRDAAGRTELLRYRIRCRPAERDVRRHACRRRNRRPGGAVWRRRDRAA